MDSTSSTIDDEIAMDLTPLLKLYKNGRIERLIGEEVVPPSLDPTTNVESKDVIISKEHDISARIFIHKNNYPPTQKLPVLVYFHGGVFCIKTAFSPNYHNYLNSVTSLANVIGVSVNYRRAPEHPVPIAYEDSWLALKWIASHVNGNGSDEWLNQYADLEKVFLGGDSAGANISHYLGLRVVKEKLDGVNLQGLVYVHPYFWGVDPIGSESDRAERVKMIHNLWRFACPTTSGSDDPLINPAKDPNLGSLGCKKVLVCVAEKDLFKDRGWYYKELLEKTCWDGVVEVVETEDEDHVFHMFNPSCEKAKVLLNQVVSFIKSA
ncbi:probable carboxylesterase 12 [Trifolium pratense]|uniref:probable carboxylesterase 12 n=1 Tax=Trifolium pratense TaxID=57577 RepID=UPI001E69706B|nr:probable carboxylesterase 12 [Trifolium pratense]